MIVVSILTTITLSLTLLSLATSFICFLVGRPRIAIFFFCMALDFFRRFAFFLSQLTATPPMDSFSYNVLSDQWANVAIWGGALFFLAWSWWDFWHNLGGIKGAQAYTRRLRATKRIAQEQGQQQQQIEDSKQ